MVSIYLLTKEDGVRMKTYETELGISIEALPHMLDGLLRDTI